MEGKMGQGNNQDVERKRQTLYILRYSASALLHLDVININVVDIMGPWSIVMDRMGEIRKANEKV